jgi:hypothetical protein
MLEAYLVRPNAERERSVDRNVPDDEMLPWLPSRSGLTRFPVLTS